METVQSVVHLEHAAMAANASQLSYAQRPTLHRSSQSELGGSATSPYKLQQARAVAQQSSPSPAPAPAAAPTPAQPPPAPAPVAASPPAMHPGRVAAAPYPASFPAPRAGFMPSPYGGSVAYRDNPYSGHTGRGGSAVNSVSQGEQRLIAEYSVPVTSSAPPPPLSRPHRISLLQPAPPQEYLSVLQSRPRTQPNEGYREVMVSAAPSPSQMDLASPAFKKIRLGQQQDSKPPMMDSVQQPLRVETGEPAYNPQVEAISPTLPGDNPMEDSAFRATKDDLLQQIGKVDREIAKAESQISKLKKKQQELEELANKPATVKEEVEITQPKHQSLAQKIYAENRKKAQEAHDLLEKLGPKVDLPLYNQPSDTAIYHENKRRHQLFRQRLVEHLRRQHAERRARESYLAASYARQQAEWAKKVERLENSAKRRAREAKSRELFEKVFPELRKQREDRERFNRVGARIKSEADLEEIMDGLQEQELEDKKMRSYAVIPPILLDTQQRRLTFVNNNGHTEDYSAEYKERTHLNLWTDQEREQFKEKYLQHVKNFGVISQSLDRKTVCECVQYYYLTKKTENFKQIVRKSRQRTRASRNNPGNKPSGGTGAAPGGSSTSILGVDISTGVTTRQSVAALQREQQQKQEQQTTSEGGAPPAPSSEPTPQPSAPVKVEIKEEAASPAPQPTKPSESGAPSSSSKKKERRKEDKKKEELDSSEEECAEVQDGSAAVVGPHPCAVCKATVESSAQSRALVRAHAAQYGLREDEVLPGARVCATCRCKAVRSRYVQCPIPTCPTTKGRVKRLRPLPGKWNELSAEVRDPIITEFQIPTGVGKCCSACHSRISRRLSPVTPSAEGEGEGEGWPEEEVERLRRGVREHGTHWARVATMLNQEAPLTSQPRTQHQCKAFFFSQRKKLALDIALQEYHKAHEGEERKPVVTDEEESGSSTSSCDEGPGGAPMDSSDTASAASPSLAAASQPAPRIDKVEESPAQPGSASRPLEIVPVPTAARDEYDSSATETADEGQGGVEAETQQRHSPSKSASSSVVNGTLPAANPQSESTRISVKDLMLNVIERTLMKPVGPGGPCPRPATQQPSVSVSVSGTSPQAPTIDSILKTDRPVPFPSREYRGSPATQPPSSQQQQSELPKEGLVVMQVQQALRESNEGVTLDLSMRRRTSPPRHASPSLFPTASHPHPQQPPPGSKVAPPQHARPLQPPPEVMVYREGPPGTQGYYHAQDQSGRGKSPSMYVQDSRAPHLMMSRAASVTLAPPGQQQQAKMQHSAGPPPPLTPKLVKGGSITHGTPVSGGQPSPQLLAPIQTARYEGMIRGQPKESGGSITQGTSLQQLHDKRPAPPPGSAALYEQRHEIYKHRGGSPTHQFPPSYSPAPPSAPSPSTLYRPPYAIEQQLSSRQIIMNDYITSQQMVGRRGSADKDTARLSPRDASPHHPMYYPANPANPMYASNSPQRTPPPPQPQQRQGVIQRHTARPPQPPASKPMLITQKNSPPPQQRHAAYPPGHEAFSSLVDVASQQPSLPVPKEPQSGPPPLLHEGLGKGLVDAHLLTQHHNKPQLTEEQEKALLQEGLRRGYVNYQTYNDYVKMKEHDKRLKELHHQVIQHHQELNQYNAIQRQREIQMRQQQEMRQNEIRQQQQQNELRQQQQNEIRQNELRQNELRQNEIRQNELRQHEMRQNEIRQNEARQNDIRQQQQQQQNEMRQNEIRQQQLEMRQNEQFLQQNEKRHQQELRQNELRQQQDLKNEQFLQQNEIRHQNELRQQQELRVQQDQQRRHMAAEMERQRHLYQQSKEREATRLLVSNYQHQPGAQQQAPPPQPRSAPPPQRGPPQQATPPPPRPAPPPNPSQPGSQGQDSSTMTAASLIHAIITHQINQSSEPDQPPTQPRPGDTLFQGFQRDSTAPPTSQASSAPPREDVSSPRKPPHPEGEEQAVITLGEHIDSIISKDLASPAPSFRYEQPPAEHWKMRRKETADKEHKPATSSASLAPNERQIIRIAQPTSPRPSYHEPVSPPEQPPPAPEAAQHWLPGMTLNFMQQRFHPDRNQPPTSAANEGQRSGKSHISPLDYVKNRIVEVMRTSEEDHSKQDGHYKRPMDDGENEGDNKRFRSSPATSKEGGHDDDKREEGGEKDPPADSPQSTDMVIDEEQGKLEPVSPANSSASSPYYPPSSKQDNPSYFPPTTYAYPYSALSVRAIPPATTSAPPSSAQQPPVQAVPQPSVTNNPPQAPPARPAQNSNPAATTQPESAPSGVRQSEPAPLLSSQYEPLSDAED